MHSPRGTMMVRQRAPCLVFDATGRHSEFGRVIFDVTFLTTYAQVSKK